MTSVLNGEWFKEHEYNPFGRPMTLKKGQTIEASGILYHLADSKLFRIPAGYPEGVKSIGIVNCPEEINFNLVDIEEIVSWQETSLHSIPEQNKVMLLSFFIEMF